MKTFVVYFEQVNQTSYSVKAEDSQEAVNLAVAIWRNENGPRVMEIEVEETTTVDSVYFGIEKLLSSTDLTPLKGFFECHVNNKDHLELVLWPFLNNIAMQELLKNAHKLNSDELEELENHVRQSVHHYVDKFIERGITEYRKYGPLT